MSSHAIEQAAPTRDSVPARPAKPERPLPIAPVEDPLEHEAERVADRLLTAPAPGLLQRACACGGTPGPDGECAECRAKRLSLQRQAATAAPPVAPPIVDNVLRTAGSPLDAATRSFFEPKLGHDLADVRVHTDARAAASADAVGALAYTVGQDVVFGAGQYAPTATAGRRLLAHELAHVAQQRTGRAAAVLRRTPARKVSCAPGPLNVPGAPALAVADPVATITAAEDRANEMLDSAIEALDYTINQIAGGAEVGWPTISDTLGHAMQVMGLNPDDRAVWTGKGIGSAGLLLRRMRLVRGTVGEGSFFFTCLGSAADCATANAFSPPTAGQFRITFCRGFWDEPAEAQADTLLHESWHNFADFVNDVGREGNAECYSRFAQIVHGVPEASQRADLCPDP